MPCKPQFYYIKVRLKGIKIIKAVSGCLKFDSDDYSDERHKLWSCCANMQAELYICYPWMARKLHFLEHGLYYMCFETRDISFWEQLFRHTGIWSYLRLFTWDVPCGQDQIKYANHNCSRRHFLFCIYIEIRLDISFDHMKCQCYYLWKLFFFKKKTKKKHVVYNFVYRFNQY